MSVADLKQLAPTRWRLNGVLDFTTVSALALEGRRLIADHTRIEINLSGVTAANSAGLALLLEWADMARAAGCNLLYTDLPDALRRIAVFSNILTLLPLAAIASTQTFTPSPAD